MALSPGVHLGAERALEVLGELDQIAHGPVNPELARRMVGREDSQFQRLLPVNGAPRIGSGNPEHLVRCVVQARQLRLPFVPSYPRVVGQVGLLQAAIVRDVLALSVEAVQLKEHPQTVYKTGTRNLAQECQSHDSIKLSVSVRN